jgi:hypothetical protein
MQSNQNTPVASTIGGNAYNPIIISDDDHRAMTYAEIPLFSGFDKTGNSSSNGSTTTSTISPHFASATTMQHPHNTPAGTITTRGYAYNPIIISEDEDEDYYSVRLFLSVFADMKESSGLPAQESTVRELVREMMGCD